MNKQRTIRILGAAALLAIGPVLYAKTSGASSLIDLCHNDLLWGTQSASLACSGGKLTAGTSTNSAGHKQFIVNLVQAPSSCPNAGLGEARLLGTTRNGTLLAGCGADDYTADGTSVANAGDGTCDAAYGFYFAISCDNPCGPGCGFNGDECVCGVN